MSQPGSAAAGPLARAIAALALLVAAASASSATTTAPALRGAAASGPAEDLPTGEKPSGEDHFNLAGGRADLAEAGEQVEQRAPADPASGEAPSAAEAQADAPAGSEDDAAQSADPAPGAAEATHAPDEHGDSAAQRWRQSEGELSKSGDEAGRSERDEAAEQGDQDERDEPKQGEVEQGEPPAVDVPAEGAESSEKFDPPATDAARARSCHIFSRGSYCHPYSRAAGGGAVTLGRCAAACGGRRHLTWAAAGVRGGHQVGGCYCCGGLALHTRRASSSHWNIYTCN